MEWYWWALIAAGAAAFVVLKVTVSGRFMKNMKKKRDEKLRRAEEDE